MRSSAYLSASTSRESVVRALRRLRGSGIGAAVSRGALGAFGVYVAGAAGAFGLHVLLSRLLGSAEYGVYIYVVTWVSVLAMVARMGLDTALVRYLPAYGVTGEWDLLHGILRRSVFLVLAGGVVVAALMAGGISLLGSGIAPGLTGALWVGCLVVPALALTLLVQSALRGFRRVPLAEIPDRVVRPLLLGGFAIAVYSGFDWRLDARSTLVLHLVVMMLVLALGALWLNRAIPDQVRAARPIYRDREWLSTSFPLIVLSAIHLVLGQIDILMVGAILGTTEAGVYAVAGRIAVLVVFSLLAINVIVGPMISHLYTRRRMVALQRIVTLTARGNLMFSLAVGVAIVVFGRKVLLLFGPGFDEGYAALLILTLGQLANALAGSVGLLMTMTGYQRDAARIMVIGLLINVGLNAVLIPSLGLVGAAIATAITTAIWNLRMLRHVREHLGIEASAVPAPW